MEIIIYYFLKLCGGHGIHHVKGLRIGTHVLYHRENITYKLLIIHSCSPIKNIKMGNIISWYPGYPEEGLAAYQSCLFFYRKRINNIFYDRFHTSSSFLIFITHYLSIFIYIILIRHGHFTGIIFGTVPPAFLQWILYLRENSLNRASPAGK